MKNIAKSILIGAVALCATSAMAIPSTITKFVPETMNYQGYLANPSTGAKYTDGIYDIECRLYRQASGGTAIWGARYSVYVKDGYFNIMLGDDSSVAVSSTVSGSGSTTYGKSELMKALWYYSSSYPNLWLGVTPLQNASHQNLANKSEISPRQQLLTAPYAFRAQSAQYANESETNFKVNGNLTVTGSFTLPLPFTLGNNLKIGSDSVRLGGSASTTSTSSASNPDVYQYADYIYNYAYHDITTQSSYGNMRFTTPSSKGVQFNGGSFAVTNNASGSVISLSSKKITLDGTWDGVTIKGYPPAQITTDGSVVAKGSDVKLEATNGEIFLYPATTNNFVRGKGRVSWYYLGDQSTANRPMMLRQYSVSVSANSQSGSLIISGFNPASWTASVAGFESKAISDPAPNAVYTYVSNGDGGSSNAIRIYLPSKATTATTYKVNILFIQKAFCDDGR